MKGLFSLPALVLKTSRNVCHLARRRHSRLIGRLSTAVQILQMFTALSRTINIVPNTFMAQQPKAKYIIVYSLF